MRDCEHFRVVFPLVLPVCAYGSEQVFLRISHHQFAIVRLRESPPLELNGDRTLVLQWTGSPGLIALYDSLADANKETRHTGDQSVSCADSEMDLERINCEKMFPEYVSQH